ncbi:MAG: hypothetical protein ACI4BA_03060 [Prevotella sp.]
MKKLIFVFAAMMAMGTTAMAQNEEVKDNQTEQKQEKKAPKKVKKFDAKEFAKKQTERMVKTYNLDPMQADSLLKVNEAYADVLRTQAFATGNGRRPAMRPGMKRGRGQGPEMRDNRGERPDMRGKSERPGMKRAEGTDSIMPKHQLTEEQKQIREERLKKMQERTEAYNNAVKGIMTKEQYEEYSKGKE